MRSTRFAITGMAIAGLTIAGLIGCAAVAAFAEDNPRAETDGSANPSPRYSFKPVDDGFVRLDNVTGQMSFCNAHAAGWACQAVPEDRAALEKEIARLQDQVVTLKDQVANLTGELAALREPPPPPRPPADLAQRPPDATARESEDARRLRDDIQRARGALENAWRRLVDMLVNFQKDMMRKG